MQSEKYRFAQNPSESWVRPLWPHFNRFNFMMKRLWIPVSRFVMAGFSACCIAGFPVATLAVPAGAMRVENLRYGRLESLRYVPWGEMSRARRAWFWLRLFARPPLAF